MSIFCPARYSFRSGGDRGKDDNFRNVLKRRHFDRFTHQTLFAQTATFSASALGGRDLAPLIA